MNNRIKSLALATTALLLVSCGGGKKTDGAAAQMAEAEKATLVATETAEYSEVPQTEVYTSTVEAYAINNIAPQTGGRIEAVNVDVGSMVSKGQILAKMDASQLDQSRLKLANDSTELERLKGLYQEGGVSKSDFEAAEMGYNISRRSFVNLLENTVLRSPISGVVTARNYDRGDLYAGQPIFVVQQITPVKLLVGVSESDYSKVKIGNSVEITADALPGKTFTGRINKIYPTVDASTHTFITEIIVSNGDKVLRPGMFTRVKIEFGVNTSITVSDDAIVKMQGSGQKCVYVLQDDRTVKQTLVTLGRHFGDRYEILEGLQEGQVYVTKGSSSLKDGSKVEISNI